MQKAEAETVAQNIMIILKRTGDEWRELTWEEYKQEREKDGAFSEREKDYFIRVLGYTVAPEHAARFCPDWGTVYENAKKETA